MADAVCLPQAKTKKGKTKGKKKAKGHKTKPAAEAQPQAEAKSAAEAQAGNNGLARAQEADNALETAVGSEDLASIVSVTLHTADGC